MPQVSVIIPTFNNAQYIGEALNSVFSQDYDAYEVIVVDDGSTDDTQQTLKPYLDRIRFIYQSNAGSAAARNTGLTLAQGEFIVFLDADDFLLPGKLKQQVAYLTLKPQLGIVHSGWRIVSETGAIISTVEPWHEAPHLDLETWLKYKPVKMGPMMFHRIQT
jgi:glycosyltransferase involved in cell wall biosynthesis